MAPKVLFFFCAFGLLFLLFKLFVLQYSIEYSAFAKAAVAALILGKVVPILDWAQFGSRFEGQRRILVIAIKTGIYALVVVLLGIGERIFGAFRKAGSLSAAISLLLENANVNRFMGLVLLISLVLAAYLTIQEIDRALGDESLYRLLVQKPGSQDRRLSQKSQSSTNNLREKYEGC